MPDRIVYCIPLMEDVKIGHLNLLFKHNDQITECGGRFCSRGCLRPGWPHDNAIRLRLRRLLRKSMMFFENISTSRVMVLGRFEILAAGRPIRVATSVLRPSPTTWLRVPTNSFPRIGKSQPHRR